MTTNHKPPEKATQKDINISTDSTTVTLNNQDHSLEQNNRMTLRANAADIHDQRRRAISLKVFENIEDAFITKRRRVVESITKESNSPFININNISNVELAPIVGYAQTPLLPLSKACAPLIDIVKDISFYVQIALDNTPELPSDGLTIDESAAIRLYTMEWEESHNSLYSMLNYTLKHNDRQQLKPYFKYMKLFITALVKLPCIPPLTIWRGVTKDISTEFPPDTLVTSWSFLSCTTELTVLESNAYLGKSGNRTLFSIEAINCRTIRSHSDFTSEDEVLLLPGSQMIVQSQCMVASDLHIVHMKQIKPNEMLLEPPFEGAKLYPKNKHQWYRKKRFIIPICLLTMILIAAIIIGSVLGTRFHNSKEDTTINWKGNNWAFSCDFNGVNFSNVTTESSLCGPTCLTSPLCTHFTWVNVSGGTCFMKQGNVSKQDAFHTNDPSMLCGVEYLTDYIRVNQTVSWDGNNWAYACEFEGNDLSNVLSTAADCGGNCSNTPLCTHFTWTKYNGGTCFMKYGNVSQQNAVSTNDQNMICGIAVSA